MPRITMEFAGEHDLSMQDIRQFNNSRIWYRSEGVKGKFPKLFATYQVKEDGAAIVRWVLAATIHNPGVEVILAESSSGVLFGIDRVAKDGILTPVERPTPSFQTKFEAELYEERLERARRGEWDNVPENLTPPYLLQIDGRAVHGLQIRFPEKPLEQVLVNVTNQYLSRLLLEDEDLEPSTRYQEKDVAVTVRFPMEVAKRMRRFVNEKAVSPSDLVNQAIGDFAETTNW